MHRELPLHIFIRNTVILCLLFFVVSVVIIESRKVARGENSIFNSIMIKKTNTRNYNNSDFSKSKKQSDSFQYSANSSTETKVENN
ncbi:MAG: hypothetical protein PF517_19540 [Salinivirgaceae bacterium]|jgi:hypothetical protein|nr:hypothetical protein [Salinivirgaceae bacterium]